MLTDFIKTEKYFHFYIGFSISLQYCKAIEVSVFNSTDEKIKAH